MTIKTLFAAVGLSLTLGIGANAPAHAQSRSLKEVQVADLRTMKDKFVGLAEAFLASDSVFSFRFVCQDRNVDCRGRP